MRSDLAETLTFLNRIVERAAVVPLLFGTAVLELRGVGDFRATDLDVIVSEDGARCLASVAGVEPGMESGDGKFRSALHFHLNGAPLVIDVMADLNINTADGWRPYRIEEAMRFDVDGMRFSMVSLADLRRFYRLAARVKDAAKIAALDAELG